MDYKEKYDKWLNSSYVDQNTKKELISIRDDKKEIEDRFYKELEFGTGGLRGVMGAGSNRMNIYTVEKATQGLADYINDKYGMSHTSDTVSVGIAYDSRNMSQEFAETAARVLCANNIKVNLFESLRPTPMLSYAVRYLKSNAGIVITASHNPKQYNGYKVYGNDGGQVTDDDAKEILSYIEKIKSFSDIKMIDKCEALGSSMLTMIGEEIDKTYYEKVKSITIRKDFVKENANKLKVIYTPLHGSGNIPVRRVLKELGYDNVFVVKEQEKPDGNFPTVSYPNPENPDVFHIALNMAESIKPDLIFGTDPDCDRIGVIVKDKKGTYKVLTGNQTGVLLTYYILSSMKEMGILPRNGAVVKTIVTTDMAKKITDEYNVTLIDVLTGFKYIGEKIKEFEKNKDKNYIFGFEESFGYLAGNFVRDKDAVIASALVCEMALYYKQKGMTLYDALIKLYKKYGFYKEGLVSIELDGKEGQEKINKTIDYIRCSMDSSIENIKIVKKMDYKMGIQKDMVNGEENRINLPKSNVLKFVFEDESWFVVRPSGTEPKIKIYISVKGSSFEGAQKKYEKFKKNVVNIINAQIL